MNAEPHILCLYESVSQVDKFFATHNLMHELSPAFFSLSWHATRLFLGLRSQDPSSWILAGSGVDFDVSVQKMAQYLHDAAVFQARFCAFCDKEESDKMREITLSAFLSLLLQQFLQSDCMVLHQAQIATPTSNGFAGQVDQQKTQKKRTV